MAIGADEAVGEDRLLPVRMLNEFAYCPRLFFLEWVQGEFVDNVFTVEGQGVHRRVDHSGGGALPGPEEQVPFKVRSVSLSSATLGLSAKIDLVEGEGGVVSPVDYKRGPSPKVEFGAYEPERVQLCAYGLLLREHGYACEKGVLYFAQSRQRIEITFAEALVARTRSLLAEAKAVSSSGEIPPPLRSSPKCEGCSLHAICLPDEVNLLRDEPDPEIAPRQLLVSRDDARPLYVQEQGARLGLNGDVLEVRGRDRETRQLLGEARLYDLSQVVLFGNVQLSAQALRELFHRGIPVCWMSYGGWLSGLTEGLGHNNVSLRRRQFKLADDGRFSLALARRFVRNKIANGRTLLRRNHPGTPELILRGMKAALEQVDTADSVGSLLGIEGNAARLYFEAFPALLSPADDESTLAFDFRLRSRRPPKDPVNALLSFAYSLLAKDVTLTARAVGLDPYLGFYHQPRHGRPALALDVMEEFRPIIADSIVLTVVNTGVVRRSDFVFSGLGVALKPEGRRRFLAAYERRLEEEVTHPVFGYRVSYRRVLEVQCRLLARYLMGEIDEYPEFRTR